MNLMSNGVDLLTSLRDLPFEEKSEVSSALATFLHRNVKPTFKEVWESKTDRLELNISLLLKIVYFQRISQKTANSNGKEKPLRVGRRMGNAQG